LHNNLRWGRWDISGCFLGGAGGSTSADEDNACKTNHADCKVLNAFHFFHISLRISGQPSRPDESCTLIFDDVRLSHCHNCGVVGAASGPNQEVRAAYTAAILSASSQHQSNMAGLELCTPRSTIWLSAELKELKATSGRPLTRKMVPSADVSLRRAWSGCAAKFSNVRCTEPKRANCAREPICASLTAFLVSSSGSEWNANLLSWLGTKKYEIHRCSTG
jgi:hypothetical protein